jgi:HAMP domain-containing protein
MSRRSTVLTLQGWMLAVLLPGLGVLVVVYATLIYFRLHDFIIAGFDAKLTTVSTTLASFVEPADHARLVEPLPLGSLAPDFAQPSLWALDTGRHQLMRIRTTDGAATDTGIRVPAEVSLITNARQGGELFLADTDAGRFYRFSTATGVATPAFRVEPPITAIATAAGPGFIYVAGRSLRRVNLATGEVAELGLLPETLRDLTWDPDHQVLWGLSTKGNGLVELDPANGSLRHRAKLTYEKSADAPDAVPPDVALKTLVYDPFGRALLGTATSVVRVDPPAATVSNQGYLPSFGQEEGPIYRRYAGPMTRIMDRSQLTYLYTQVVQGRDHITYGLDGTVGKDHSALLSTDTAREGEVDGIQRLLTDGAAYVSPIEAWPPWGKLKTSFAPIFNEQGRPVAMAGADVNADMIQLEISRALVITFGFGAAMLIVGGAVTLALARRLTEPLTVIKAAALHAAAGDYSRHAEVARPRELRHLAQRFTSASATLGREMAELKRNLSVHQSARDRAGLIDRLGRVPPLAPAAPAGSPWAWGHLGPNQGSSMAASGAVSEGNRAIAWIARTASDPVEAAARRVEIAVTAEALLTFYGSETEDLIDVLQTLFPVEIAAWVLLKPDGLHACLRQPGLLFRCGGDRPPAEIAAPDFAATLRPEPGEVLVLAGAGAPLDALPDATFIPEAAGLLAAWRAMAPAGGPRTFAVVSLAPTP